jgi:hypothetical protein
MQNEVALLSEVIVYTRRHSNQDCTENSLCDDCMAHCTVALEA